MIRYDGPHRPSISAYIDGCRSDCCRPLVMAAKRARKRRANAAAGAQWRCLICDARFMSEAGRNSHETQMHRKAS